MTLKNHIGILILMMIAMYVPYVFSDKTRKQYEWWVPSGAGLMLFCFVEAIGWIIWFFFVV